MTVSHATERSLGRASLRASGYVLAILYFVVMTALAWRLHSRFLTHALDLGYFDQILWSTAHGQWFANTLKYPYNFLGDHLSPILLLVAPVYWLWPNVRALLAIQTLALALAGLPIFWLARRVDERLAPLVLLAFYLDPALHLINLRDFHEIALVTPFVALAVYALLQKRYVLLAISLFLVVLCKEDMAILTLAFGVYLLFDKRARGWGAAISLFSIAYLTLALQAVIPSFREEGEYGSIGARYGYLGATPGSALRTVLFQPWIPLGHLARWDILAAFLLQLAPTGFIALLGWPLFALSLPVFLYLQLSDEPSLYTLQEWHVAPLVPLLFGAAVVGWSRLRGRWRILGAAAMVAGSLWAFSQYSLVPAAWSAVGTSSERAGQIEALISRVSPEAVVSAQTDIVPHMSQRRAVYVFPSVVGDADDIMLDRQGNTYPVSDRYNDIVDKEVLPRPDFRPYYDRDGLLWLHKETPPLVTPPLATFGDRIQLRGASLSVADSKGSFERTAPSGEPVTLRPGDRLQANLYWQATEKIHLPYTVSVQLLDEGRGQLVGQHDGPPAQGARPADTWQREEVLRDTHYVTLSDTGWIGPGRVLVSLYDPGSGRRLVADQGQDSVPIARFDLQR